MIQYFTHVYSLCEGLMSIHKTTRRKGDPYLYSSFLSEKNIVKNERMFYLQICFVAFPRFSSYHHHKHLLWIQLIDSIHWMKKGLVWSKMSSSTSERPRDPKAKEFYLYRWYCLLLPHPIVLLPIHTFMTFTKKKGLAHL